MCALGLVGSLFVGYCIYFDIKRRSDPDYKKKVLAREGNIINNTRNHSGAQRGQSTGLGEWVRGNDSVTDGYIYMYVQEGKKPRCSQR